MSLSYFSQGIVTGATGRENRAGRYMKICSQQSWGPEEY